MRPLLYSSYFALSGDERYRKLAGVLRASAAKHIPLWDVRIEEITPNAARHIHRTGRHGLATNTDKLHAWCATVDSAEDGARILLIDSDTFIRAPLDPLWDIPFDIAYTHKGSGARLPINGGVFALRVNERSRAFMKEWRETNDQMYSNPTFHTPWRTKYAGINQASLGYLLEERNNAGLHVCVLDCATWNACFEPLWEHPNGARIIHVKSALRRAVLGGRRSYSKWRGLVEEWLAYAAALEVSP